MKSIYLILSFVVLLLFSTRCTLNSSLEQDLDEHRHNKNKKTEPVFFITNDHVQATLRKANSSSETNIGSENNQQSISVSMKEENWNANIPKTRTIWTNSSNTASWVTGDKIGVYMQSSTGISNSHSDRYNVQYSVASSGALTHVTTPIYFPHPYNNQNNMIFYAYYPYSTSAPTNSTTINYNLPSNQSSQSALANADIMRATSNTTNGSSPNIALPFNHQMVLLSFQIKGTLTLISSATLTKVQLSGSAITNTGSIDLKTGLLSPNATTFSPYVEKEQKIKFNEYGYADIIVNPFVLSNNSLAGNELLVTLTFKLLNLALVEIPVVHTTRLQRIGTFVTGTRYMYTLNVTLSL